ncbi:MAG: DUF134 domain-containing protein [Desulfobacteraceae bacterium]|nr:DUF134 domain-containing protein [Desulfobacteraceae bacterium]
MPRPRMFRRVGQAPVHTFYKPQGVPLEGLTGVNLTVEGLEAMRLADAEARDHDEAADMMGVSRPTFSRMLNEARGVVAKALSNGWAIHIDGGHYKVAGSQESTAGMGCGRRRGSGCTERSRQQAKLRRGPTAEGSTQENF